MSMYETAPTGIALWTKYSMRVSVANNSYNKCMIIGIQFHFSSQGGLDAWFHHLLEMERGIPASSSHSFTTFSAHDIPCGCIFKINAR